MIKNGLWIPDSLDDGTDMGDDIIRAISQIHILSCLTERPLTIGDKEQCEALRLIEEAADNAIYNISEMYGMEPAWELDA